MRVFIESRFKEGIEDFQHALKLDPDNAFIAHYALGNKAQSDEFLANLLEEAATGDSYLIAMVYGFRGEVDKAFEFLDNVMENNSGTLAVILSEIVFLSLHSDPRWQPLLEKVNLLEYCLEMPPEWGGPQ